MNVTMRDKDFDDIFVSHILIIIQYKMDTGIILLTYAASNKGEIKILPR